MGVWKPRMVRFWLVILLPAAFYFGIQSYKSHASAENYQTLATSWLKAMQDEPDKTKWIFDYQNLFNDCIQNRDNAIAKRSNYLSASITLSFFPGILWLVAAVSRFIMQGKRK